MHTGFWWGNFMKNRALMGLLYKTHLKVIAWARLMWLGCEHVVGC
jgi:hypothetical protein